MTPSPPPIRRRPSGTAPPCGSSRGYAPLAYGTWGPLKRLYKAVEASPLSEPALFGALAARLDAASLASTSGVSAHLKLGDLPNPSQVAVRDNLLFVMGGHYWAGIKVGIYDLNTHDPLKPRLLSAIKLEQFENAQQMTLCGDLLCLATSHPQPKVTLYDVSDPAHPRLLSALSPKVAGVRGREGVPFLYLSGASKDWAGLQIVDVSRPDHPVIRGEEKILNIQAADGDGALACVVVGQTGFRWNRLPSGGGLRVLDVTRPDAPRVIGSLDLDGAATVTLVGRMAHVGITGNRPAEDSGLQIVDLSDPTRPRKLGFCPLPGYLSPVQVRGGLAFCAVGGLGLHVLDVSDPSALRLIGKSGSLYAQGFALTDRTAYVVDYRGVAALDITRPASPTQIGLPPSAQTMAYLKRRVRRVLRTLAKRDPDAYVRLAYETLAAGAGEALEPTRHWVSLDMSSTARPTATPSGGTGAGRSCPAGPACACGRGRNAPRRRGTGIPNSLWPCCRIRGCRGRRTRPPSRCSGTPAPCPPTSPRPR